MKVQLEWVHNILVKRTTGEYGGSKHMQVDQSQLTLENSVISHDTFTENI